ncbi:MAG: disulfide bond formation protein B [Paracoccaceae bacterium]
MFETMTSRPNLVLLAAGGSAAMLAAAFLFQHVGGIAPCELCLWQRWPHAAAVLIGLLALMVPGRALPRLGALAALTTAGIGLYHSGIERGLWPGPASCTGNGGALGGLSGSDLLSLDAPTGLVMCDKIAWEFAGLSMANLNLLASLVLALIWLMAARNRV